MRFWSKVSPGPQERLWLVRLEDSGRVWLLLLLVGGGAGLSARDGVESSLLVVGLLVLLVLAWDVVCLGR